jgi:hypothetical protein
LGTQQQDNQQMSPFEEQNRGRKLAKGMFWKKYTPSVSRFWLRLIAGLLWTGVGGALCVIAGLWLSEMEWPLNGAGAGAGFLCGVIVYRFGFSRIVGKNIKRIEQQPDPVCLFAFQAWRSYFLILSMVVLGYVLRHSNLPRMALAIIYSTIGTGLTLSSALYYERVLP